MKKLWIFIIISVFTLLFSCKDMKEKEYDLALSKAQQAYVHKQYVRALSFYKQAAKIKPGDKTLARKIEEIQQKMEQEQKANQLNTLRHTADSLFDAGKYEEAKEKYQEANLLNPDDTYFQNRISEIESLLLEKGNKVEEKAIYPVASRPYHIIVGSFVRPDNAYKYQEILSKKGYESLIIQRPNGFRAVSVLRYPDIHEAYNNLNKGKTFAPDAWILKY